MQSEPPGPDCKGRLFMKQKPVFITNTGFCMIIEKSGATPFLQDTVSRGLKPSPKAASTELTIMNDFSSREYTICLTL